MKVAITLNDVIRDFTKHFSQAYHNNIGQFDANQFTSYEHIVDDIWVKQDYVPQAENAKIAQKDDPFRLSKKHVFNSAEDFKDMLYNQFSFEFFATNELTYPNAMNDLNLLYQEISKKHQCTLLSQEINNSKPATLHFLSYNRCLINNIKFLENYSKVWQIFDVIITANQYILKRKNLNNEKKISIKIETEYNKNIKADYSFASLNEVYEFYKK